MSIAAPQKTVSVGNAEIDKKLGGGIPVGSLIFIEGKSDAGKSVLTQQLMWGSLRQGFRVALLSTEDTVKGLIRQMQSLNLDIQDYLLLGRLKVFPMKVMKARDGSENALDDLLYALHHTPTADILLIDSVTSFLAHASTERVVNFFEECKSLCGEGATIAIVAHSYAFDPGILIRISSMCDTHLRLSLENMGERLIKVLEVSKVRGAEKSTGNIISFDVEPGMGMRIIPFTKAKA